MSIPREDLAGRHGVRTESIVCDLADPEPRPGRMASRGPRCARGPVFTELFEGDDHPVERLPRALWLHADRAAQEGLVGLERGRRVVIPGAVLQLRLVERVFA